MWLRKTAVKNLTTRHDIALSVAVVLPIIVSLWVSCLWTSAMRLVSSEESHDHPEMPAVFARRCTGCHGLESDDPRSLGPSLHNIGAVAATRRPSMTAAEYILESVIDPGAFRPPGASGGMPEGLVTKDANARAIVAYLLTYGGAVHQEEIDRLDIPDLASRKPPGLKGPIREHRLGEAVFRGKGMCITCHPLASTPSLTLRAPSLLDVASVPPLELHQAIVAPSATIAAGYENVIISLNDGAAIAGRLIERVPEGLYVMVNTRVGDLDTIFVEFSEMAGAPERPEYEVSGVSSMPEYESILSDKEIDLVVAFLKNRNGGGSR